MEVDNFDGGQILRKNLIKVQYAEERLDSKWYQSTQAIIGEETVISAQSPFSHNTFHLFSHFCSSRSTKSTILQQTQRT